MQSAPDTIPAGTDYIKDTHIKSHSFLEVSEDIETYLLLESASV